MERIGWKKSSFCSSCSDCVEVAKSGNKIAVRDSKDNGNRILSFTRSEWTAFIKGVKSGEFDFPE